MFGADRMGLFGTSGFFLSAANPGTGEGLWQYAYWLFQVVFAATAATIVSGAMAERTKFSAYLIYTVFISAIIYPVAGHWIWGGGWLSKLGMVDFAGSTVVHSIGGMAGLIGAIMVGPRLGKYNSDGSSNVIAGHNMPLAALGVFILWFGWFGFNPGSTTSGVNLSIATIAVTTNLAAAAGAFDKSFVLGKAQIAFRKTSQAHLVPVAAFADHRRFHKLIGQDLGEIDHLVRLQRFLVDPGFFRNIELFAVRRIGNQNFAKIKNGLLRKGSLYQNKLAYQKNEEKA
jgi:ammonia channel protein AmtB